MTESTVLDIAGRAELKPVVPTTPINVRLATMSDFDFIDALQKKHSDAVGFFHKGTIEGYIEKGDCLIAEEGSELWAVGHGHDKEARGSELWAVGYQQEHQAQSAQPRAHSAAKPLGESPEPKARSAAKPLGYCFSRDTYHKREDCGIIYQINIVPGHQRGLIGAALLKEVFHRAPYGVKLYCCWCAQDLGANHFWEAMGFTPLAFRTGSAKRGKKKDGGSTPRMHVFWQKRIREGDVSTPWWFPSQTTGGAIGAGRIVIPIPVGTHWSDEMPVILPGEPERLRIEGETAETEDASETKPKHPRKKKKTVTEPKKPRTASQRGGLRFGPSPEEIAAEEEAKKQAEKRARARKKQPPRKKMRNNPKFVAAARELRDRFLEEVERSPELLEGQSTGGKYDVSRQLEAAPSQMMAMEHDAPELPMLDAA